MNSGFTVVADIVSTNRCQELVAKLPSIDTSGSRTLLSDPCFAELSVRCREHAGLQTLLQNLVAVQCTFFRKSQDHNWSIRLHRDTLIPVKGNGQWPRAGIKEGLQFVRPDRPFLDRCVAVRISLDDVPEGDLIVVPNSHLGAANCDRNPTLTVRVPQGGALIMRPTLLHASAKLQCSQDRRVLHYLFAPKELPAGYQWHCAF